LLAAIPAPEAKALELFRLALTIMRDSQRVSPQLSAYFDEVLRQARALDQDPTAKVQSLLPEAIQLALDLRERSKLRTSIENLPALVDVSPAKAGDVLRHLEESGAT
jgi:hypothetical protein